MSGASDRAWSRNLMRTLRLGRTWGLPRNGLVFTKTDEHTLTLTDQMPHNESLPMTEAELVEYQDAEFVVIRDNMAEIGVTVRRGQGRQFGIGRATSEKSDS